MGSAPHVLGGRLHRGDENLGGGGFGAQQIISSVADGARSVYAADLDGDGDYSDGVDGFRVDVAKEVPLTTWQAVPLALPPLIVNSRK